jgi:hypothetical protein
MECASGDEIERTQCVHREYSLRGVEKWSWNAGQMDNGLDIRQRFVNRSAITQVDAKELNIRAVWSFEVEHSDTMVRHQSIDYIPPHESASTGHKNVHSGNPPCDKTVDNEMR